MKETYTIPEIAKLLKVSRHTVYKWVKKGYLPAYQPSQNAAWRVTRRELSKYFNEHNIPKEVIGGDRIKILIVDDDVNFARSILRSLGDVREFDLETAHSGFSAGVQLMKFSPDVILLDIYLGDIDGRELFERIKENPELNGVKVIGMSGKLTENEIQPLLEQGFYHFFQKPFNYEDLKNIILKGL